MDTYGKILNDIKTIAKNVLEASRPSEVVTLTLVATSPPVFRKSAELELETAKGEVILPRGIYFMPDDIGKNYVFAAGHGGQQYYFLYERGGAM